MKKWMTKHKNIIENFLSYLNKQSINYILKGGTSLMCCYGLDRFSEDIDLDSTDKHSIENIVASYCKQNGFSFRIAKDTDTVKRYMVNYGNASKPLKIEVSFRRTHINEHECLKINGINVYDINVITSMKASAYASRDRIRDMYDLAFICDKYWDNLNSGVQELLRSTIEYKGVEQFDYLTATQSDELINNDVLAEKFLMMYDKLGLISDYDHQTDNGFNAEADTLKDLEYKRTDTLDVKKNIHEETWDDDINI